jgi:hypothetical protein
LIVAGILVVTTRFLKPAWELLKDNRPLTIFLLCVLYAVLMPRMKIYSYILLLAPTYFLLRQGTAGRWSLMLFLVLVLPVRSPLIPTGLGGHFLDYYSLYLAFLVWGLYIGRIHALARSQPFTRQERGSPPAG